MATRHAADPSFWLLDGLCWMVLATTALSIVIRRVRVLGGLGSGVYVYMSINIEFRQSLEVVFAVDVDPH